MESYHQVILDQKPCVVCYLNQFDRFLVGTYELYPELGSARKKFGPEIDDISLQDTLDKINQRAGKLIIINHHSKSESKSGNKRKPGIDYEYDCHQGGGVFDAKVCTGPLESSIACIYAAHSNGLIGVYNLTQIDGTYSITQRNQIRVCEPSILLTSIDLFVSQETSCVVEMQTSETGSPNSPSQHGNPMVVGDSKGFLSVLDSKGSIRESLGENESIWQVKYLNINQDYSMIIAATENCSWSVYTLNRKSRKLSLIYKNQYKDFQAGVTSIHCLRSQHQETHCTFDLLFGSYDESLQAYQMHIELGDNLETKKPSVIHLGKSSIEGGGIWRIKPASSSEHESNDKKLLIAAMYAGTFALKLSATTTTTTITTTNTTTSTSTSTATAANSHISSALSDSRNLVRLIEVDKLGLSKPPLHYDIDISLECSARDPFMCIADFNNSMCLLIPIKK